MKILYYNWADYLSEEGGGVTVYIKNILNSQILLDHEVFMISSGNTYSFSKKSFWRELHTKNKSSTRRFEIVNSQVIAPACEAFGNKFEIECPDNSEVFLNFLHANGPFDIIHFHNIEGLSLSTIKIAKRYCKNSLFIFSAHNYFPLCPQVNLWIQGKNTSCEDYNNGKLCSSCSIKTSQFIKIRKIIKPKINILNNKLLKHSIKYMLHFSYKYTKKITNIFTKNENIFIEHEKNEENYFEMRRRKYIQALNEYFDIILCVSDRVKEIYQNYGVDKEKLITNYIGTPHAKNFPTIKRGNLLNSEGGLTLTYLGYARHDKGFFFLMDALEKLPNILAKKIAIQLAVRVDRSTDVPLRIAALQKKLGHVHHTDGYTHDQLREILKKTDIGIIPVLWEDNLPQVALEMHCYGIPLLCSDMGGAPELANNPNFIFKHGSTDDFINKLEMILDKKLTTESYWANALHPVDMEKHVDFLLATYQYFLKKKLIFPNNTPGKCSPS